MPELVQNQWSFAGLNELVNSVFASGEEPLMNIKFAPDWQWTCTKPLTGQAGEVRDSTFQEFADYMARLVSYYNQGSMTTETGTVIANPAGTAHKITFWELWNEPDLNNETPCAPSTGVALTPTQYVTMWNAVTAAMLRVDPTLKFVGPATAGSQFGSSAATGNEYVDRLMADGVTKPAAISFHGYGFWDNTVSDKTIFDGDNSDPANHCCGGITDLAQGVKAIRAKYSTIPVWLTEVNVNADWGNDSANRPSSELAAAWWGAAFQQVAPLGAGMIHQYDLADGPQFGLIDDQTGNPYVAYYAFKLLDQAFPRGSTMLSSTSSDPAILSLAARKPDGTISVMVVNRKLSSDTARSSCGTGGIATPVDVSLTDIQPSAVSVQQLDKTNVNCTTHAASAPAAQAVSAAQTTTLNFPGYGLALLSISPAAAPAAAPSPPSIAAAFGARSVPVGGSTSLTFQINNPNPSASLTAVGFTDDLPNGLQIADSPDARNNCGGTLTAAAGGSQVALSGASVDAGRGCSVSVAVSARSTGKQDNTSGAVTSSEGGTGNSASASLSVASAGDWTGSYGSGGYVLGGWNGSSDLVGLPGGIGETLQQGARWTWIPSTSDPRALQSPDGSSRTMATYYDDNQVKVQLSFPAAYTGNLHLYALDPDSLGRRESITVDDGSGPKTVHLTTDFSQGAWVGFPVSVAAGGTVAITVTRDAGANAVLSGIMLGDAGAPPAPGGLHVNGAQLLTGSGSPIQLHGVDRAGTEYACINGYGVFDNSGGSTPGDTPTNDDAQAPLMQAWHANSTLVGLNEDCWLGTNVNNQYSDTSPGVGAYADAIKHQVATLESHGIYPVIALFWSAPGTTRATGQWPMPDNDHSPLFWQTVANAFKGDRRVVFRLKEEPFPGGNSDSTSAWHCWSSGDRQYDTSNTLVPVSSTSNCSEGYATVGMQSLINIVRGTGATNVIQVPGVQYANSMTHFLDPGIRVSDTLKPAQLMGDVDVYPNGNACGSTACYDGTYAPVAAVMPFSFGEFGEDVNGADCSTSGVSTIMSWADAHGASYSGWDWDTWGGCLQLINSYTAGNPNGSWGNVLRSHLLTFPANTAPLP